ncbi:hypothetical protein CC1G_08793 [Coprinopsis cinerea okayama7|uniref:DUF6534 domain-containing protein n=1 Tax=Coprinopsis cinerea (strain Okayama-7 / 130 / ATCC MYA-4618 / FGSC 9003) TaxID=240176 RepID=A8N443_COPC7|nr:hypothetical protein CC1G_08793 [Coprinopsis cinerea okayama7\|eukprot:XP_001829638.2 hypothetical protein CC1G_08793 [Coprinopsis cinerea okayama7\
MAGVQEDLAGTYGALLLGGFLSACLTGVVGVQTLLYFKIFPMDRLLPKLLVAVVCLLDMTHSAMVWAGIWEHLIVRPRTLEHSDFIPAPISLSIVTTGFLTFLVHLFFAERIHRLSGGRWILTVTVILIAGARLGFACATAGQMLRLKSFAKFVVVSSWTFTLGLALSSAVDLIVTVSLFLLLRDTVGPDTLRLGRIIDSLVMYTIEIGSMTLWVACPLLIHVLLMAIYSIFTVISMICWLAMRHNLVFLGLHFIIGKLYANSLLATYAHPILYIPRGKPQNPYATSGFPLQVKHPADTSYLPTSPK